MKPTREVIHGDCLDVMRGMADASVDAVVTDPPYGLEFMGKEWDAPWKSGGGVGGMSEAGFHAVEMADGAARLARPNYLGGTNQTCRACGGSRRGREGKKGQQPCRCATPTFDNVNAIRGAAFQQWAETWAREALRVAKPGAHLLAFGGTRTFHRLTCAIEDAGWEIRDCLSWLYGSGFPKSLDVSKAIDKTAPRAGMFDAFARHFAAQRAASGLTQKQIAGHFLSRTGGLTGCVWNWENGANVPTAEQWEILRPMLGLSPEWTPLIERIEAEREVLETRRDVGGRSVSIIGREHATEFDVTAPATDLARQWAGWGTALKPAWEPIILARKPLIGTVAANVAAHGTGGLNIDGCRIGTEGGTQAVDHVKKPDGRLVRWDEGARGARNAIEDIGKGRWPANVALDEAAAAALDAQGGERPSTLTGRPSDKDYTSDAVTDGGLFGRRQQGQLYGDTGGPSRFFYTAKASRAEREAGLEGAEKRKGGMVSNTSGQHVTRRDGGEPGPVANHHPTVKPVALMRWLCRLVTPPDGIILDPFAGSGSTGIAAVAEGFRFLGIEKEAEYAEIARRRIAAAAAQGSLFDGEAA